jgi:hypothetical protein
MVSWIRILIKGLNTTCGTIGRIEVIVQPEVAQLHLKGGIHTIVAQFERQLLSVQFPVNPNIPIFPSSDNMLLL